MSKTTALIFMVSLPAIAICYFIYSRLKYKSFKGAMFNAEIENTEGEVKFKNGKIRVHSLRSNNDKLIGLECSYTSLVGCEMTPHTLSIDEAKELIEMLKSAASST